MAYSLERTVKDADLVPVSGALVYVYDVDGNLADLVTVGDVPTDNPATTGADGYAAIFAAHEGFYTLKYNWAGRERLIEATAVAGRGPIEIALAAAAYAESMAGPTYASTGAGLAATTDGQGFAVDNGDGTVTVYLNSAGVAVAQRMLATSAALSASGGAALVGFLQSGTGATARTVQDKLRECPVSIADFSGDTATALAAALVASDRVFTPSGAISLGSNVSLTGAVSWRNEGTWSGAGIIDTTTDYSGFNYSADFRKVRFVEGRGTAGTPDTNKDATGLFSKHSNVTSAAGQQNPTLVAQHYKWNTTALTVGQALFAEAIDKGGNGIGRTDFVEGIRTHAIGMGGNAYGIIALGQVGDGVSTPNAKYAIAVEGEVIRTAGSDAVDPLVWTSANNLDASYLATCRIGVKPMAGFMVNPFNEVTMRCGFMVGNSFAAQGATKPIVDFAAFATIENSVPHGLYVRNVTYSWASVPNNIPLRAVNAAGSAEHNILDYGADNTLAIGTDATAVRIKGLSIFNPPASATPGANGELVIEATSNTSLTFKLKGSDGTVRSGSIALS